LKPTIFIDADGCPVVDITTRIASDNKIDCIIICDTSHEFEKPGAKTITVDKGTDSVDFRLVNMLRENDIVVTQDYGLAAMCLAKKAIPINQDGMIYSDKNIDELLHSRYIAKKIRNAGGRLPGPHKREALQDESFKITFKKLIKES